MKTALVSIWFFVFAFYKGFEIGVRNWHREIFNYRIPLWATWIIVIILMPLNVLISVLILICKGTKNGMKYLSKLGRELVERDYEASI